MIELKVKFAKHNKETKNNKNIFFYEKILQISFLGEYLLFRQILEKINTPLQSIKNNWINDKRKK